MDKFEARLAKAAGKTVPVYITEIGVPTYDGKGGLSKDVAAQYVVKYTLANRGPLSKGYGGTICSMMETTRKSMNIDLGC